MAKQHGMRFFMISVLSVTSVSLLSGAEGNGYRYWAAWV